MSFKVVNKGNELSRWGSIPHTKNEMNEKLHEMNRTIEQITNKIGLYADLIYGLVPSRFHPLKDIESALAIYVANIDDPEDLELANSYASESMRLDKLKKQRTILMAEIDAIKALECFCKINSQELNFSRKYVFTFYSKSC
ncbi:MAG TPA: hypothetical protein VLG76_00730 [Rhabdochlamydiaceae bacterium]|nr:hypothetical protein [Rhabdochlamydiaceae bacterium]